MGAPGMARTRHRVDRRGSGTGGIVRGLEPANRYQLSDGVRDFWELLDAGVP
jgi:hypothetical protein